MCQLKDSNVAKMSVFYISGIYSDSAAYTEPMGVEQLKIGPFVLPTLHTERNSQN